MAVESVDIEFRARLDDFKKTLETIPGLTKKSARELTTAWTSEIKKAEKQSGDSIQNAAKEAEKLEKVAAAIGGPIGDGIRQIGTLAKGAGAGLGGMGTAMLGLGAGVAVVMAAGFAVGSVLTNIEAYDDTIASLQARDLVTDEQVGQLHAASEGWKALGNQASGFAVIVATKVAKSFMDLQVGAAAVIGFLQDGLEGAKRAAREVADAQADGAKGFSEEEKLLKSVAGWEKNRLKQEDEAAKKRLEEQQRKDAQAAKSEAQAQKAASATQQLSDIVQAALFAEMDAYEKILEVERRQLERIDELERAGADHAVAEAARAIARDTAIKDTWVLQKAADEAQYASMAKALDGAVALGAQAPIMEQSFREAASATSLALDALGDDLEGLGERNGKVALATKEDWQAAQGDLIAASAGAADGMLAIMDVVSDAQAGHLNKDSAEYRKNRKRQFAAHKAAAIAEAAINTAVAFSKTMSQYAYPINIVLGALTIAAGVGTIATIAAQKPQFYTGGMVSAAAHASQQADAVDATLHDGEGVLTRRGVASMGGPEAVRAANAGQGSGGATVVAVSMLDSRILGDVWAGSGPRGSGGLMARVDSRLHGGLPGRAPPRSR